MAAVDTLYYRLKLAVRDRIIAVLPDSDAAALNIGSRVYSDIVPDRAQSTFPCVYLTLMDEAEQDAGGTTEHKYHNYSVRAFLADHQGPMRTEREALYLAWRDAVAGAFEDQRQPATVDEVQWATVRYDKVFDKSLPEYEFLITGVRINFLVRTPRTA